MIFWGCRLGDRQNPDRLSWIERQAYHVHTAARLGAVGSKGAVMLQHTNAVNIELGLGILVS
jgi:hypothetical protein